VSLVVRIHDIHPLSKFSDRFNRTSTIQPRDNAIVIPVADSGAVPRIRKSDLAHVWRVFLFAPALNESVALKVSALRLEK
jgi:hypothetical protein